MKSIILTLATLGFATLWVSAKQEEKKFTSTNSEKTELHYLLHTPKDYDLQPKKHWPLILFLHGAGERGNNLQNVKKHGPPMIAEADANFPFILISPQCPEGKWWDAKLLEQLLTDVAKNYRVEENCIYLTGLSMGGFGTWQLACAYPEKFAAIAPICGGGDPTKVKAIVNIPTWVFHGEDDPVVPIKQSEAMVTALKAAGGKVTFTRYPHVGHDSWTKAYEGKELFDWFLTHKKVKK